MKSKGESHFCGNTNENENQKTIEQDIDTGFMALCAIRYCFGRSSYAPSLMVEWVKRNWSYLKVGIRRQIYLDVQEFIFSGRNTDRCDLLTWQSFRDWLKVEIENKDPAVNGGVYQNPF